jgi:Ring finger domain
LFCWTHLHVGSTTKTPYVTVAASVVPSSVAVARTTRAACLCGMPTSTPAAPSTAPAFQAAPRPWQRTGAPAPVLIRALGQHLADISMMGTRTVSAADLSMLVQQNNVSRRSGTQHQPQTDSATSEAGDTNDRSDDSRHASAHHHIPSWPRQQPSSYPATQLKSDYQTSPSSGRIVTFGSTMRSCAVCVDEYAPGDQLRIIDPCGHAYHVHCIDLWLSVAEEPSCPVCKTPVASPSPPLSHFPAPAPAQAPSPSHFTHPSIASSPIPFQPVAASIPMPAPVTVSATRARSVSSPPPSPPYRSSAGARALALGREHEHFHPAYASTPRGWSVELIDHSVEVKWVDWVRSLLIRSEAVGTTSP